jgi:hypothetical protein
VVTWPTSSTASCGVVPVDGGTAVNPLAQHPEIDAVGGIGWSPDGRRLAFEGTKGNYPNRRTYLWTIRPDGTGLRRLFDFGRVDDYLYINDALAWTRNGILYSDGRNLRSVKAGESRLVLRRVSSVRISGDGRHIVTTRYREDGGAIWMGSPDGTDQHRILSFGEPWADTTYDNVTPNYDGSALLAYRSTPEGDDGQPGHDEVVTWPVADGPESATVIDVVDGNFTSSWNRQQRLRQEHAY